LLCDPRLAEEYRDGRYVTLRLKSSMYHRFHAPHDGRIERVTYISGDTWNVNPMALRRIERLFCKNERAIVRLRLKANGQTVTMAAVAAILVASIRLHCLGEALNGNYRGLNVIDCASEVHKGDELGWFEHGSTIIVFAPNGFTLDDGIREGVNVHMGESLMRLP
ncbi:MAG TPA: phosphatidylserine decarboxylase, partial [Xanthobacteraceae bacterium]|nr:phosphatidylserine decarboxylase [Xanthobacteraceae bacterium]